MADADRRRFSPPVVGGVLAVAALFVTLVVCRAHEPLALDQGLFACFGRWLPRGWLPYRDLFDSKPPLFLYTWALGSSLPGDPATAMWRFEAIWLGLTLVAAGRLAARRFGALAGVAAAAFVLVGLWSPAWGGYWARAQAEELLALPLLAAAGLALAARDRPRLAFWVGVLTGVIGLYKIPAMAVAAAWPLAWISAHQVRGAARLAVTMALGLLAPWLVAVAWFAAHGAVGDLVLGVLTYQRHFIAEIDPPWSAVLRDFVTTVGRELGWLLVLAAAGLARGFARRAPEAAWLAAWIGCTALAIPLQRQLAEYHYMLLVPGLALAAAWGLTTVIDTVRAARPGPRAAAALALALAAGLAIAPLAAFRAYRPVAAAGPARQRALVAFQRGTYSPGLEESLAAYLAEHTSPDERLLIWGLDPGVYALANRAPVTRFAFHKLLLTDARLSHAIPGLEARRRQLLEAVERRPPRYIVVGRNDQNAFDPVPSTRSLERFAALQAVVDRDYRLETEIGRYLVYRHVD